MPEPLNVIAIDGPAGAGKTTVAREVAKRLGFTFLETGAMYRAVACIAKGHGLSPSQGEETAKIASHYQITLKTDPQVGTRIFIDGEDISEEIRTLEMGEWASALSAYSAVRKLLVARQREIALQEEVVLEGRDTTTVVCPEARLKIFLTASLETRALRIYQQITSQVELTGRAKAHLEATREKESPRITYEQVLEEVRKRDERDSNREDSPLKKAPDAIEINTDDLSVEQVVQKILSAWNATS